ncbi:MAG: phenylacetic acid degradation operon negative regulatory protein [Parcubacteria group bacterium Athens0714_24]|nr:MAG: phenylacetic acid degradation operon negative regulatory protein [Parcubacteria group bacterium Athens0714_24]
MKISSETKQKIILLLSAGYVLGFTRSPKNYFKILTSVAKKWKNIERKKLFRIIKEFYNDRIVDYKEKSDGTVQIVLTKDGKQRALKYQIDEIKIKKPEKWDKKWRMVIFDIPEKNKKAREALRIKLKELGFKELQKSVFVHPYSCEDEIDFIVEVFEIRPYVRLLVVDSFTNEEQFRLKFNLI